jgi:hypothetical protein
MADAPVIATKKYVDSGLATRVKDTIFDSFKTSSESFQNRTEGFATAAQGKKADTAVQPAALDNYVQKPGSWWTNASIVPASGNLPGSNWTYAYGSGLSSSWVVRNTSMGYEFRGWSNCSNSSSNSYTLSNTLSENSNCWCKLSDPLGSSWLFTYTHPSASLCAVNCANNCSPCVVNGAYHECTRLALLNN